MSVTVEGAHSTGRRSNSWPSRKLGDKVAVLDVKNHKFTTLDKASAERKCPVAYALQNNHNAFPSLARTSFANLMFRVTRGGT
jgi:hypothetical protein